MAKPTVKRPGKTEKKNMTEQNTDPLADILGNTESVATPAVETNEADESAFDIGDIVISTATEVPNTSRSGGGNARYPFAQLPAPTTDANGKPVIGTFTVPYKSGDEGKFKRSVQSATTQANRNDDGKYFESRTVTKDGKLAGVAVYRTDARPAKDEAKAE